MECGFRLTSETEADDQNSISLADLKLARETEHKTISQLDFNLNKFNKSKLISLP